MLYSKSTNGFYSQAIHGVSIPNDALEITDIAYKSLLEGQSAGKIIAADESGNPFLQELLAISLDQRKQSKSYELTAAFTATLRGGFTTTFGIKMDAELEKIQLLKSAYDLIVLLNVTDMPILVDYNNDVHVNVPMTDVIAIIIEVGMNYQTLYAKKQTLRGQVMAAANETELNLITWS
jgi:hypothetical protein